MRKGKIIKEIIGNILFPHNFKFYADKRGAWVFYKKIINKEEEEILLEILLVRGVSINELILELRSNAYGRSPQRPSSFVPNYKKNLKVYKDEKEFIEIVKEYAEIIEKYGLSYLETMSEAATNERPKKKDYQKFYKEYKKIAVDFMEREGIREDENVDTIIEIISDTIIKNADKGLEETINLTLELAAFYTLRLEREYESCWEESEIKSDFYFLRIKKGKMTHILNPIMLIFLSWHKEKKEIEEALYSYLLI